MNMYITLGDDESYSRPIEWPNLMNTHSIKNNCIYMIKIYSDFKSNYEEWFAVLTLSSKSMKLDTTVMFGW